MINLIPPAYKDSIIYARRNSMLIGWFMGISIALLGIVIITMGSLFYLKQDTNNLNSTIEQTTADLSKQKETEVVARAEGISANLKLVVDVLSNEILFSKFLQQIGLVMPPGTVLESLSLTNELSSVGIDLEIGAQSYEAGTRAHVNLNDLGNGIFEKADLINISCNGSDRSSQYPCLVQIRALFARDHNPFLLINDGVAS